MRGEGRGLASTVLPAYAREAHTQERAQGIGRYDGAMGWKDWLSRRRRERIAAESAPGQFGPYATREVAWDTLDPTAVAYQPDLNGEPDPGEVVWTWVPFEEEDGRGKDRPVLILVREAPTTFLAVHLTAHDHGGDAGFVPVGPGTWDSQGRPSWVSTRRLLRIHTAGIRREGAALAPEAFDRVAEAIREGHS